MRALCLGGAGRICRESVLDLVRFSDFERITVADVNESEGRSLRRNIIVHHETDELAADMPQM